MIRYFIVPNEVGSPLPVDRPKYFPPGTSADVSALYYGPEKVWIVRAEVTDEQVSERAKELDCITIPEKLQAPISLGLIPLQTQLEALHVPADWLTVDSTWEDLLSFLKKIAFYLKLVEVQNGSKFFKGELALDSMLQAVASQEKASLDVVAAVKGVDLSEFKEGGEYKADPTVRQVLMKVGADMAAVPLGADTF